MESIDLSFGLAPFGNHLALWHFGSLAFEQFEFRLENSNSKLEVEAQI